MYPPPPGVTDIQNMGNSHILNRYSEYSEIFWINSTDISISGSKGSSAPVLSFGGIFTKVFLVSFFLSEISALRCLLSLLWLCCCDTSFPLSPKCGNKKKNPLALSLWPDRESELLYSGQDVPWKTFHFLMPFKYTFHRFMPTLFSKSQNCYCHSKVRILRAWFWITFFVSELLICVTKDV